VAMLTTLLAVDGQACFERTHGLTDSHPPNLLLTLHVIQPIPLPTRAVVLLSHMGSIMHRCHMGVESYKLYREALPARLGRGRLPRQPQQAQMRKTQRPAYTGRRYFNSARLMMGAQAMLGGGGRAGAGRTFTTLLCA
jgi:hypothetical protein